MARYFDSHVLLQKDVDTHTPMRVFHLEDGRVRTESTPMQNFQWAVLVGLSLRDGTGDSVIITDLDDRSDVIAVIADNGHMARVHLENWRRQRIKPY